MPPEPLLEGLGNLVGQTSLALPDPLSLLVVEGLSEGVHGFLNDSEDGVLVVLLEFLGAEVLLAVVHVLFLNVGGGLGDDDPPLDLQEGAILAVNVVRRTSGI